MAFAVTSNENEIRVDLSGRDRLFLLKSHLRFPLRHVLAAHVEDREMLEESDVRPHYEGTRTHERILSGNATIVGGFKKIRRQLWVAGRAERIVVVELENERYEQLVLCVDDPDGFVAELDDERSDIAVGTV